MSLCPAWHHACQTPWLAWFGNPAATLCPSRSMHAMIARTQRARAARSIDARRSERAMWLASLLVSQCEPCDARTEATR